MTRDERTLLGRVQRALIELAIDGDVSADACAAIAQELGARRLTVRILARELGLTVEREDVPPPGLDAAVGARARLGVLPVGAIKAIAEEFGCSRAMVRDRARQLDLGDRVPPPAGDDELIG